jgi:hypothetical protein
VVEERLVSDLHTVLLLTLQPLTIAEQFEGGEHADDVNRLRAVLRAVVELHAPRPCTGMAQVCAHLDPHNVCSTCGASERYVIGEPDSTARCSTIQVIARELGVDGGE